MKKISIHPPVFLLTLLVVFFSCNEVSKKDKSYSATLTPGESVKALAKEDLKFVYDAYNFEHYNIQLANEAKYRSVATETVNVAVGAIKSSQQLKQQLSEIATQYDLALVEDMSLEQKEYWKELVKHKGWDFDKEFSSITAYNLKYANALYSQAAAFLKNEALKTIANTALNNIKSQEQLATVQQEKIKEKTIVTEPKDDDEAATNNEKKKRIK